MTLEYRILPERRRRLLSHALANGRCLRVIEAHNGLSSLVGSTASIRAAGGAQVEFDGLWASSLTTSAAKGLPDAELYSLDRRLDTIQEILAATTKPVIVDLDTGGIDPNFTYVCTRLEAMGVSAVVIEDKLFPKRNSLLPNDGAALEDVEVFAAKIARAREALLSDDFLVFGRIESLITGRGVADALVRARAYLKAGAAGLFIHSKAKTTDEIVAFMDGYKSLCQELGNMPPVIATPTTYGGVTSERLFKSGVRIVVHANHVLRAAHKAMQAVCERILLHDRNLESEDLCTPIPKLLSMVGNAD